MPTMGTIAAAIGAAIGGVVTVFVPGVSDNRLALLALGAAAIAFGTSSWSATALGKRALGPVATIDGKELAAEAIHLLTELRAGYRHLRERVTPFHALAVMAAARLLYGMMFVAAILISRHILAVPGSTESSIKHFTLVLGFAAIGFGLAAVITPAFAHRVDRHQWIVACLLLGAVGQTLLAVSSASWALLAAAVIVSFSVQGGKIAVDTIVQRDTTDAYPRPGLRAVRRRVQHRLHFGGGRWRVGPAGERLLARGDGRARRRVPGCRLRLCSRAAHRGARLGHRRPRRAPHGCSELGEPSPHRGQAVVALLVLGADEVVEHDLRLRRRDRGVHAQVARDEVAQLRRRGAGHVNEEVDCPAHEEDRQHVGQLRHLPARRS